MLILLQVTEGTNYLAGNDWGGVVDKDKIMHGNHGDQLHHNPSIPIGGLTATVTDLIKELLIDFNIVEN